MQGRRQRLAVAGIPASGCAINGGGSDPAAIRAEHGMVNNPLVLQRRDGWPTRAHLPNTCRVICGGRHDSFIPGTELGPPHMVDVHEGFGDRPTRLRVPYPRGSVLGGSDDEATIVAESRP